MTSAQEMKPIALIADDDQMMRLMLNETLEQAGFAVVMLENGETALSVGRRTDFAVAILDVEMPGRDGYSVCTALRACPGKQHVPIIMITSHDDEASIHRAYRAGATDFISKPLNWPLLAHRLRYVMRNAEATRELEARDGENRALIQAIPDQIHLLTADGRILRALSKPTDGAGHASPDLRNASFIELLPAAAQFRALALIGATAADGMSRSQELQATANDGEVRYYEMRYFRCVADVMAVRQDVTLRRMQQARIRELAYFDSVTRLPNRASFLELTTTTIADLRPGQSKLALLQLRFEGIERIDQSFGRQTADAVLLETATALRRLLEDAAGSECAESLAHTGAADFAVLLRDVRPDEAAQRLALQLVERFKEPLHCNGRAFFVRPRTGIAIHARHGMDAETLLRNGDLAMRDANSGVAGVVYSEAMSARALDWLSLDAHLRLALRSDQLSLQFQPKLGLQDQRLAGCEALLRWTHPEQGPISPGRFIPLAEETGLIIDLGEWVINAACQQLRNWRDQGFETSIAINISGSEFAHGDPAGNIRRATQAFGIEPSSLQIEITESVLVDDSPDVRRGLLALRQLGCRISLDDFGTGYSSLAYLKHFVPDTLKIDQAFVRNVHSDPRDAAIVESILALARSLNLTVIAEGIEVQAQLDWLLERGCQQGQGYLLGRPMSAARLAAQFAGHGVSIPAGTRIA
jgi:EAL domain-containing protein (putative c-di-GMP-specific phosphodiesterase class I)/PleD family two-component response regulator